MASFPSIRIEGGLLGPELLDQLLAADVPGQKPADFGLDPKRNLTDEIAAAFADGRALWGVFQNRLARVPEDDLATTVTRDQFALPFLALLGYQVRYNPKAFEIDGQTFAVSHRAGDLEEAPPIHIVGARQELGRVPASGRPRLAPHSLVQEYLNRTEHVWGIVLGGSRAGSNGLILRLLRDSTLVRRQAYVEFDLAAIFDEQRFHDFAALYRLLHRTRLPRGIADASGCLLEKYHAQTIEQGGRVREHLRDGVEECLKILGNGFLAHPCNEDLRKKYPKLINADQFYRELLRLVYRFLFLLVSEDRGLVSSNPIYRDHYGVARIRRMLDVQAAWTSHSDLWLSLRTLFRLFQDDKLASMLDLAPLNGELFASQTLDDCTLSNHDLLRAFWHLAYYRERGTSRRVNYAALDVEELGSVYESLLEYHPDIAPEPGGALHFDLIFGSDRKTTGSYYTAPELVNQVIQEALDPVIAERLAEAKGRAQAPPSPPRTGGEGRGEVGSPYSQLAEKALLSLKVIDPACGSGHFLLSAARRIGKELARVRTGEDEPAPERIRESIRDVISHCIYGVDKNPLAVDLCRVALWIESHTAGRPLSFLDHRIRPGDSLVGIFDLTTLAQPIPDAAYKPLVGDDKAIAREIAAINRAEGRGNIQEQLGLSAAEVLSRATARSRNVDSIPDESPADIQRKKKAYDDARRDPDWKREWQAANLWTAAFFAPLTPEAVDAKQIPTTTIVRDLLVGRPIQPQTLGWTEATAHENHFFHWQLEFPEVFASGGFDVVLSNPPWEHVELKEQEFFESRNPKVAAAPTKAARAKAIEALRTSQREEDKEVHREYQRHLRTADASRLFLAESGRYPLAGKGRINTYAVFAELIVKMISDRGRAGIIVPTGIATDDGTKELFGSFVASNRLIALIGYENEDFIFEKVHHAFKFCTVIVAGAQGVREAARLAFFIRQFDQLREERRFFRLSSIDFKLLNPNTGNCPIFRTRADAELTKAIYRRVPALWRETEMDGNPWQLSFSQGLFNLSTDSHHFRTRDQLIDEGYKLDGNIFIGAHDRYLPVYEAKMLHQFDHRFSTYEGATESQLNVGILPQSTPTQKADPNYTILSRFWVRDEVVESVIPHHPEPLYLALQLKDEDSVRSVLLLWLAGYELTKGNQEAARHLLFYRDRFEIVREVAKSLRPYTGESGALHLQKEYPLTASDVSALKDSEMSPMHIGCDLVSRFTPRWFLSWRDITNAGNERTLVAGVVPVCAIGNSAQLAFRSRKGAALTLCLLASLNSLSVDYVTRQKVGGMHINQPLIRQLAVLPPSAYGTTFIDRSFIEFIEPRVLELVYTANDITPIARDCGYEGPPFSWNEDRRFQIRAELDAAFLHAYLGSSDHWQPALNESREELINLRDHFPTPKDAAEHILNSFPLVREKDEKTYGHYRTGETILALYETFTHAHRTKQPWLSPLSPPPGHYRNSAS